MRTAIEILEAKIPEIKTRKSDYSVMDIRVMNVLEIMEEYANQYKQLLSRYIQHVKETEGVDFIDCDYYSDVKFTEKEFEVLRQLSENP